MTVTAQYHGQCTDCLAPIIPGEQIEPDGDEGWQHIRCYTRPARVECVCERCFTVHAGEC